MRPTLNRSLPAELQPMPFNLQLMEVIGIQGPRRNLYRFWLAFGWGIFVIIFPKSVLGMGSSEFNAITKGLGELLFQVNLYGSTMFMVVNMASFERMIQLLSEIIRDVTAKDQPKECYELIREQNSKCNKFARFYFFNCCFGPVIYWIPAMTTSYIRYFGTGNGTETVQFELPMEQEFYGLHIRTNFAHYHFFMVCALPTYYLCAFLSVIKVTSMLIMIRYSSLAYQVVAIRIRKLTKTSGQDVVVLNNRNGDKVDEVIKIVQLHSKALEITDLVEKIVNIPLAMQFLCCIMFWCLVMVYVSINVNFSLINVMVPFWLSLIETYGFSFLGSELTESANNVAVALYDMNWYNDSVQLQRYYQLILQRAQRVTGVTAAKFFIVGKEKFMNVVKMSYSYYLVLKDTLNKL